jgi:hypothetical protein
MSNLPNLYDNLFYCYYLLFKLFKRSKPIDHLLASNFLSVIISYNILTICTLIGWLKIIHDKLSLTIPIVILFILTYFFNKWYFILGKRYQKIIIHYKDRQLHNKKFIIIAIVFTFLSFVLFWLLGLLYNTYHA